MRLALAATLVCGFSALLLLEAERRGAMRLRAAAKSVAALAFLAVGVIHLLASAAPPIGAGWICAGLALGVVGDVALLGRSERAFLGGLGAFLLGHLAYVVALAQRVPLRAWPGLDLLPLALLGAIVLRGLWPRAGKLRIAVAVYVAVILAMAAGALRAYRLDAGAGAELLFWGALLFTVSDLAVARDRFVASTWSNKLWGLPLYFGGQLLIAWSLAAR